MKGALGQALVQKYFEYAGWSVTPTGIEAAVDHVRHLEVDRGDLRHLPDFIVSKLAGSRKNPNSHALGQTFYVEVKTWRAWHPEKNLGAYTRFGNVLLVWVSPDGLKGTWLPRAPNGEAELRPVHLSDESFRPLDRVGEVSLEHCADDACEQRLRAALDDAARRLHAS